MIRFHRNLICIKGNQGVGEMAYELRAMVAFSDDWIPSLSTHMVTHSHPHLCFQGPKALFLPPWSLEQVHNMYTYIQARLSDTQN